MANTTDIFDDASNRIPVQNADGQELKSGLMARAHSNYGFAAFLGNTNEEDRYVSYDRFCLYRSGCLPGKG